MQQFIVKLCKNYGARALAQARADFWNISASQPTQLNALKIDSRYTNKDSTNTKHRLNRDNRHTNKNSKNKKIKYESSSPAAQH